MDEGRKQVIGIMAGSTDEELEMTRQGGMQPMTKHSKTEPLGKELLKSGWQTEDGFAWKRGDLKIAFVKPRGWVLYKLDINAPRDYSEIASGVSGSELERYLKAEKLLSA